MHTRPRACFATLSLAILTSSSPVFADDTPAPTPSAVTAADVFDVNFTVLIEDLSVLAADGEGIEINMRVWLPPDDRVVASEGKPLARLRAL